VVRPRPLSQADTRARRAHLFPWRFVLGLGRPRMRPHGVELAGVVVSVGSAVREF